MGGIQERRMMGDDWLWRAPRPAIAARMRELDNEQGAMERAVVLAGRAECFVHQFGEQVHGRIVEPKLAGIGPALANHRGGLDPEQSRAASGEAPIAAESQCVGRAVGRAVAPFHRQHHKPVGQRELADLERLEQGCKIVRKLQIQSQPRDVAAELVGRTIMKCVWLNHAISGRPATRQSKPSRIIS